MIHHQPNSSIKSGSTQKHASFLNQTSLTCNLCKKIFDSKTCALPPQIELVQHLKNVHAITLICTNCGAYFFNSKDLNDHLLEYHNNGSITTSSASSSSSSSSSLNGQTGSTSNKKLKSSSLSLDNHHQNHHHNHHHNHHQNHHQNIYPNLKQSKASSISPTSSTSSSSSSSSFNSSKTHYNNNNNNNHHHHHNHHHPSATSSSSHPLLALQAFVNGTHETKKSLTHDEDDDVCKTTNLAVKTIQNQPVVANKLPAKKRPYSRYQEEADQSSNDDLGHEKQSIPYGIKRILGDSTSPTTSPSPFTSVNTSHHNNRNGLIEKGEKLSTNSFSSSSSSCSSPSNSPKATSNGINNTSNSTKSMQISQGQYQQPLHLLQNMLQNRLDDFFY